MLCSFGVTKLLRKARIGRSHQTIPRLTRKSRHFVPVDRLSAVTVSPTQLCTSHWSHVRCALRLSCTRVSDVWYSARGIRALGRRTKGSAHLKKLEAGDLTLDPGARRVFRGKQEVHLTPTEYRLLEFLMRRQGGAASRRAIVEAVWGLEAEVEENTLDAFIRLLRSKVDLPNKPRLIHTVRGFGYRLQEESEE